MCKWGTDVEVQVTVPADESYTGEDRVDIKKVDACIAPIVKALNEVGIRTDSSCCGHFKRDGWIVLHDGRELVIRPNERYSCITNPQSSGETAK